LLLQVHCFHKPLAGKNQESRAVATGASSKGVKNVKIHWTIDTLLKISLEREHEGIKETLE
jgi:hypothetical protein